MNFTVKNTSNLVLNSPWSIHWNQQSSIIDDESVPDNVKYDYVAGQSYNILSFGTAVMFGAFVYFLTQVKSVREEYRSGVAVSAVVVGIAGYHYYRIWSGFSVGEMNEGYRYADWLITVPLQLIEFYLILAAVTVVRPALFWQILVASLVMLLGGYFGETGVLSAGIGFVIGMIGWLAIIYLIFFVSDVLLIIMVVLSRIKH